MTREEEIKKASGELFNSAPCSKTYKMGFEAGAMWADANPKSSWISLKDKLPCDEEDMVIEFLVGVELRTKKVCVLLEDGFIDITYMYRFPPHGWHWNTCDVITHWMPIPEPPK